MEATTKTKVISKRKAHQIVSKWMHAYARYTVGELEIWDFEKDCKDLARWFRLVKEVDNER